MSDKDALFSALLDRRRSHVGRHGADDTPIEEGTTPNAGQLLAMILDADADVRLRICNRLLEADGLAGRCLQCDHYGEIQFLKDVRHELLSRINVLRDMLLAAGMKAELINNATSNTD